MLFVHLGATLFVSAFFYKRRAKEDIKVENQRNPFTFFDCVLHGVHALLLAGGVIVFFYALSETLCLFVQNTYAKVLVVLFLEVTSGAQKSAFFLQNKVHLCLLLSFFLSFNGLSILLQNASFLSSKEVKTGRFIAIAFIRGSVALLFAYVLDVLFNFF